MAPKLNRAEGLPSDGSGGKLSRPQNQPKPKQPWRRQEQPWRRQGAWCCDCVSSQQLYNEPAMGSFILWCNYHQENRLGFSCCEKWERKGN